MDIDGLTETRTADQLGALGNETRLRLFRVLVRAGTGGLNVGALQSRLAIPASTLAHHLGTLVSAGLVRQTRHGREVRSALDYEAMDNLICYLTEACCADASTSEHCAGNAPARERKEVA